MKSAIAFCHFPWNIANMWRFSESESQLPRFVSIVQSPGLYHVLILLLVISSLRKGTDIYMFQEKENGISIVVKVSE